MNETIEVAKDEFWPKEWQPKQTFKVIRKRKRCYSWDERRSILRQIQVARDRMRVGRSITMKYKIIADNLIQKLNGKYTSVAQWKNGVPQKCKAGVDEAPKGYYQTQERVVQAIKVLQASIADNDSERIRSIEIRMESL